MKTNKQTNKIERFKNLIISHTFLKIILISLIFCSSCSKDSYDNYDTVNKADTVIYEIPISELKSDKLFKAIFLKKFNNKSFENFIANENASIIQSTNEFFIPEKNAVVLKTDSLISYTMLIKRNGEKVNYFENLVVQINSKNQFSANIIRYYPKKFQEQKEHKSYSLESDKEIIQIANDQKSTSRSTLMGNETCITISYSICNFGIKEHIAGSNCGSIIRNVSDSVCFATPPSGGSSGSWGWSFSNSITFPGSGGTLADGDNAFTITTVPIDPRLDIGIEGSII